MVIYAKIRRMFFREHLSISEIQRRTSLSRNTIKKWLKEPDEAATKYQRAKASGKLTPYEPRLLLALEADAHRPKRDRRTALMLFSVKGSLERGHILYLVFHKSSKKKTASLKLKGIFGKYEDISRK